MAQRMVEELKARGLVQQCTGEDVLQAALATAPMTVYVGYDPTGDSLHVGHLVTLMVLRRLHAAGHHVVVVVGGGTALIGDPSHKSHMRPMLDAAQITHNAACLLAQIKAVLASDERVVLRNNAEWLHELSYLKFLRDVGVHFSVNRMLSAEAYKSRLASGLSFLEFNYQLLQAYDFLQLARQHGCRLQVGGDDQWSNILAGVELCRRSDRTHVHGLTVPLLTTASGEKMGKTAGGAVWLDANKLHPNDFFQYWINVDDGDVERFLRIYTLLPDGDIAAAKGRDINGQKRVLAHEVTQLVHGAAAAATALKAAAAAFGSHAIAADLLPTSTLTRDVTSDVAAAPRLQLGAALGPGPWPLAHVLQHLAWVKSANEARRLVAQGAVMLAAAPVTEVQHAVSAAQLPADGAELRVGKKRRILLLP